MNSKERKNRLLLAAKSTEFILKGGRRIWLLASGNRLAYDETKVPILTPADSWLVTPVGGPP